MTDESANNELNLSNKDNFLERSKIKGGVLTQSSIKRVDTRQTVLMEKKLEEYEYSLDDKGNIEEARKHRSANKPLHKIRDFNTNVNFCRCCFLPCEEKGILEPFKYCDDIDKFAECGLGVSLYFYFIRFAAIILFVGIFVMAISMMVFNHHYTKGINRVCNNYYLKYQNNDLDHCEGFITVANESLNLYNRFNDWILRFTSDNVEVYQLLYQNITGKDTKNADDVSINYSVLNFFFLLTAFILNIFYIIFITANSQKSRLLNVSIRDYTVLISNANFILDLYYADQKRNNPGRILKSQIEEEKNENFINFVNNYIRSDKSLIDLKIVKINMCYDLSNYKELRDELEECKNKICKIKNDPKIQEINNDKGYHFGNRLYYSFPIPLINCIYCRGKPLVTLEKQSRDLEKHIEIEFQNMQELTEEKFTGYMFISFEKIKDKETILKEYPNNFFGMIKHFFINIKYYLFCCCLSEGQKSQLNKIKGIDVDDPPEPDDLDWFNFKYSPRNRIIRIIVVSLICIIIIGISFGIVLGFTVLQNKVIDNNKTMNLFLRYLLSFLISIVISIINAVFDLVLTELTFLEKHLSRTNYYLSLSIKIAIFTFFNSAIIPLLATHLIVKRQTKYHYNMDRNIVIVNDMFILFLVNALVTPLLWTFYIPYIIKKIQICIIEKNPDKHNMTQRELNKLYELPDMRIAYKYSFLAKTLAMTLFYLPIFPMGFIVSFVGFVFAYFLELFNFTHLYKRPEMLDEIITKVYADYFIVILFIGAVGDYFFFHEIFRNNKMSLATIIIFGILIIVPYTKFITCNFVGIDKSEYYNHNLSEIFTYFNDYQSQNPLTKSIALLSYLKDLNKKGYLSDGAYKMAEENIEKINVMEMYYGISKGTFPIIHQSVLANANRSIAGRNIRESIVAPNIKDSQREILKKQKYFDSQIMSIFGSKAKAVIEGPANIPMDTIVEEDENSNVKDQLINAYNNPLGINMGLGPLPIDHNIYKSVSIKKSMTKGTNRRSSKKLSNPFDEDKNNINSNIKLSNKEIDNKFKEDSINYNINKNDKNINVSISKGSDKSSNIIQFNNSKSSIDLGQGNNNLVDNNNNNNINNFDDMNHFNNNAIMPQNEMDNIYNNKDLDKDDDESGDGPLDAPYSSYQNNNQILNFNHTQSVIGNKNDIDIIPRNSVYNDNVIDDNIINTNGNNNNNNEFNDTSLSLQNSDIKTNINNSPIKDTTNNTYNNLVVDSSMKKINNIPMDEESHDNEKYNINNNNFDINISNNEQNGNYDIKDDNNFPNDNIDNKVDMPEIPSHDNNRVDLDISDGSNNKDTKGQNFSDFYNGNNDDEDSL